MNGPVFHSINPVVIDNVIDLSLLSSNGSNVACVLNKIDLNFEMKDFNFDMKHLFILTGIIFILFSCSTNDVDSLEDPVGLVGKWKLTEQLIDPGDGSGEFTKVNSSKVITFLANGTFSANGTLCDVNTQTDNSSSGTYDSSHISPEKCTFNGQPFESNLTYDLDKSILIIHFFCFEGCQQKYERVK